MKLKDITGQRFGRLVAIRRIKRKGNARWLCKCDCGNESATGLGDLTSGKTQSCGCLRKEVISKQFKKHGMSYSNLYFRWTHMHNRCAKANDPGYKWYGARGIKVCKRWGKFENFVADMGNPPPGMSLDRINNDGNYEPSNCRWATTHEQLMNKRNNRYVVWRGKRRLLAEVCKEMNVSRSLVRDRLRLNWPLREALTTPKLFLTSQRRQYRFLKERVRP